MTHGFKSIEEIKEEVAKDNGFICWNHLTGDGEHEVKPLIVDQVAQRYAKQYIDANKELVDMLRQVVYEHEQDQRSWKTILEIKELLNKQS